MSGKVSNQRFLNSCLANSLSVHIYTVIPIVKVMPRSMKIIAIFTNFLSKMVNITKSKTT